MADDTKSSKPNWSSLSRLIEASHRPHAGYFTFESDKQLAEIGVAKELEKSLCRKGEGFFTDVSKGSDPPDCIAVDSMGNPVAIEVTELVDSDAIKAARNGKLYDFKDWQEDLIPTLESVIRRKDCAKLNHETFSQYVLVIYTDEPCLDFELAKTILADHRFASTILIDKVYLLYSYIPWEGGCPYIQLDLVTD